ncbi:MAG: pathogenicity locus [Sphingobacteriales bacterium]|jgi:hypothetical protein|nr:pathogenicity locus [Sphingobacteriales bacterium]
MTKDESIADLKIIPGVGVSIANDLYNIGIRNVNDLKGKNPEGLYDLSNRYAGVVQDRCLLYVFRCAVYFANYANKNPESEKLKWWNWKD